MEIKRQNQPRAFVSWRHVHHNQAHELHSSTTSTASAERNWKYRYLYKGSKELKSKLPTHTSCGEPGPKMRISHGDRHKMRGTWGNVRFSPPGNSNAPCMSMLFCRLTAPRSPPHYWLPWSRYIYISLPSRQSQWPFSTESFQHIRNGQGNRYSSRARLGTYHGAVCRGCRVREEVLYYAGSVIREQLLISL